MMKSKKSLISKNLNLLIVFAVAVIVRFIYFAFEKDSPLFLYTIIDENEFIKIANHISENGLFYPYHFWHPPLYSYFVGFFKIIGFALKGIITIQFIIGIAGTVLLYLSLEKINKTAAIITALIWAIYPVELFIESKFLSESIFVFLTISLAFVFQRMKESYIKIIVLALLTGLLIVTKSQFLLFFLFWVFYLIFKQKQSLKNVLTYVLISLIFPLTVSFHNLDKTGKFIFVSSNGAVNFYLGNSSDIKETLNIRPREWKAFFSSLYDEAEIKFVKTDTTDINKTYPYKLSGFLVKKTLNENKNLSVPLKNIVQKTLISVHSYETPRDFDIYEYGRWNKYIAFFMHKNPFCIPLIFFMYSALILLFVKRKSVFSNEKLLIPAVLIIVNILPSIIFFNAFRYRLPAIPFIIFFSILFYLEFYKHLKYQLINLGLMIILGTTLTSGLLFQKIPLSETYDHYADGFFDKEKLRQADRFYEMSIQAVEEIKEDKTALHNPYFQKGIMADKSGDFEGAIKEYNKTIEAKPTIEAYINRATARYKEGDFKGAVADYNLAIKLNSDDVEKVASAWYSKGLTRIKLNDFEAAMKDFDKSIELNPNFSKAYANRGILRGKVRNIAGALSDFDKAIELDPTYAKVYNDRGIARITSGNNAGAMHDFTKAIELIPQYSQAYYMRGILNFQLGNKENACEDLKKSAELGFSQAQLDYEKFCGEITAKP